MKQLATLLLLLLVLQACSTKKSADVTPEQTKVKLVSPADGSSVATPEALEFTWLPPLPLQPTSYKIKIVEIKGDQSPEQALHTNKPIFEKDSLKEMSLKYPNAVPPFKNGQRYAWNVQALNRDGKPIGLNNGTSDPFTFTTPAREPIVIALLTPANSSTISLAGGLEFTWLPTIPDAGSPVSYKIKIVEIKGDESPENALHTNKPFFEKDSLMELTFTYPLVGPILKADSKYVWYILSTQKGIKDSSALAVFTTPARKPIVIALLSPANNSIISVAGGLEFTWLPTIPDAGSPVSYKITIVEMIRDESPEQAMRTNKPHFEKDSLKNAALFYPVVAPMLKAGSKYAWKILATQKAVKDSSAISNFTVSNGAAGVQ